VAQGRSEDLMSPGSPPEQLKLELDWGTEPWAGQAPRYLTKPYREGTCAVDNSVVSCRSREAQRIGTDPAQWLFFL